ncbi:MAG TPA: hypothetical protein VF912_15075 [Anaeromyxobacter sp.]
MRRLALSLVTALLGAARPAAAAPSVTLNGVNIDGVTNQKFENCTVIIDERGNVAIQAKGYAVRTSGAEESRLPPLQPQQAGSGGGVQPQRPPANVPPGRVSRRYFIATEQTPPGTQYDLGIFVNAQWIREVKASERQSVVEITKYLRPGPNKVTLAATKRIVGDRLAYGRDVALRIVIGEGNVGGDHVMIDLPIVETARTAAEIDDRTEEFVIDAR